MEEVTKHNEPARRRFISPYRAIDTGLYFFKWIFLAVLTGGLGGAAGSLFALVLNGVTDLRQANDWLLWLLPVAGLGIVWSYRVLGQGNHQGTNLILEAALSQEDSAAGVSSVNIPVITGPLIFLATCLTHLTGGSAGREGAALQLGGSLGTVIGQILRLNSKDRIILVLCGMSAVFSALFGTPLAAAVFSLEVVSVGSMPYFALLPCLFSSCAGWVVAGRFGLTGLFFSLDAVPALSLSSGVGILGLGVLCGLLSILFCLTIHTAEQLYRKWFPNPYWRILVASALLLLLTWLSGTRDYNGASGILLTQSMAGQAVPWAFALKLLFTAVTLGGGFKGGEIIPTLCVGAAFGCLFANLTGLSPSLCAACGMMALFAGVTNCPLATLLLSVELFGSNGMLYFALVIAVSFVFSGYFSLYSSQRFSFSKYKAVSVNRPANHF